ncbi:AI-2E family transporter [Bacillus tianshenii]|nr:AI-2E family transporter [Bacillus tianshenii]
MWWKGSVFKYLTISVLILIIVLLLGEIEYVWTLVTSVIFAIMLPLILSGLFYYLLRPSVYQLSKKLSRTLSVLSVFLLLIGILFLVGFFVGPTFSQQFQELTNKFPEQVKELSKETKDAMNKEQSPMSFYELKSKAGELGGKFFSYLDELLPKFLKVLTTVLVSIITAPFILFFLLRDDYLLRPNLMRAVPSSRQEEGDRLLKQIDDSLSSYVRSQALIAITDGTLMFIGYLIIGLSYPLPLALFTVIFAVVPFLGPLLGVIPALAVAMLESPSLALQTLIVFAVTQQLEGNLVAPLVMNKQLRIHPLTVIFLLLGAGAFKGFLAIVLAIPVYIVLKVTAKNLYRFYLLTKEE